MADNYFEAARELKRKNRTLTPTQIHAKLKAQGLTPPSDKRLESKGGGNLRWKNRTTRQANKLKEHAQRRAALAPISNAEFKDYGRRNGYSETQINEAIKHERSTKRQQKATTKASGGKLEVGHYTPQATTKSTENRARFERLNPGDAAANRFPQPADVNRAKGSSWYPSIQQRQQAGMAVTRAGAIQAAFRASSPAVQYAQRKREQVMSASQQIRQLQNATSDVIKFYPGQGTDMPGI